MVVTRNPCALLSDVQVWRAVASPPIMRRLGYRTLLVVPSLSPMLLIRRLPHHSCHAITSTPPHPSLDHAPCGLLANGDMDGDEMWVREQSYQGPFVMDSLPSICHVTIHLTPAKLNSP